MQNDLLLIQNTSTDSTEYEEKFVNLTANKVVFVDINNLPTTAGIGLSSQFLKADGSLDSTAYENVANKVTSFQVTPDNTHYASEKLVKDNLDLKVPYTGATADLDLGLNSLNANTIKLDGTELLIDAFKSGSLGGAGNIFYSTGASSQPASGSVTDVVGDNYIKNQNSSAQTANMWISGFVMVSDNITSILPANNSILKSEGRFFGSNTSSDLGTYRIAASDVWYADRVFIDLKQTWGGTYSDYELSFNTFKGGVGGIEALKINGTGAATFASTIQATTAKLTNLTDGYFPIHKNDTDGLVNSNIYQDGSGNVGIGTTSPRGLLDVQNGSVNNSVCWDGNNVVISGIINPGFKILRSGTSGFYFYNGAGGAANFSIFDMTSNKDKFVVYANGDIDFGGAFGAPNVRMLNNGNVGINKADPSERLDINGNLIVDILKSRVATGTPPLVVASTTLNTNLNSDLLDGQHGSYYQTASPKIKLTPEGGYAVLLTNKTGANSVKGTVVIADPAVDNAFEINPINGDMPFGVVYESGIADGSECWVVVSGIAEVLLVNTVASTRSYVAYSSSSVAGRIGIAASVPAAAAHFREIGHTLESKVGGTDVLCKCILHFN